MAEETKENENKESSTAAKVPVQDAVRIAAQYFANIIQHQFNDLAVEEVDKTANDDWLITVGYSMTTGTGFAALTGNLPRLYKTITIDGKTGEPLSMKIRKV